MAKKFLPLFFTLLASCSPDGAKRSANEAANALGTVAANVATAEVLDDSEWVWLISENETGLRLMHGQPETDIGDYTFMCEDGRLHLWYSLEADKPEPYGTVRATAVTLKIGSTKRSLPGKAKFEDYGSPDIDATINDAGAVLRAMLSAKEISTADDWAELSAPAPSGAIVRRFARRCSIALR